MNTLLELINAPLFQSLILSPIAGVCFGFLFDAPRRHKKQASQYQLAQATGDISMGDMVIDGNGNSVRLNSPDMSTSITHHHHQAPQTNADNEGDAIAIFSGAIAAIVLAVAGYIYFFDTILRLIPLIAIASGMAAFTISALRTSRGSASFLVVISSIVLAVIAFIGSGEAINLMQNGMAPSAKETLIQMRFKFFTEGGDYVWWTVCQVFGTLCLLLSLIAQILPPMRSTTIWGYAGYLVLPFTIAAAAYFILNGDFYRYLQAHPI